MQDMSVSNFNDLDKHYGHEISVFRYSIPNTDIVENVALECADCDEVLLDYDRAE